MGLPHSEILKSQYGPQDEQGYLRLPEYIKDTECAGGGGGVACGLQTIFRVYLKPVI